MSLTKEQRAAISRANGAKSKGPKTAEGKAISSRNAFKHGLSTKNARTMILKGVEREQDYKVFSDCIVSSFNPTNPVQFVLVGRIASLMWRQARVGREEALIVWEENNRFGCMQDSPHFLPQNKERLETLQVYEEKLSKQIDLAIKQLRELQSITPPPRETSVVEISPSVSVIVGKPSPSEE